MLKLWISKQVEDFKLDQNMWSFGVGESSLLENKQLDNDSNSLHFPIQPDNRKWQGNFFHLLLLQLSNSHSTLTAKPISPNSLHHWTTPFEKSMLLGIKANARRQRSTALQRQHKLYLHHSWLTFHEFGKRLWTGGRDRKSKFIHGNTICYCKTINSSEWYFSC